MIDFIPKNNIEAEESLLASLFINNNEFDNCFDLEPADFYKKSHEIVFKAIVSLINKNETADLVTVGHYLKDNKQDESIGGLSYLLQIANNAPMSLNVKDHAKIIKDCALSRRLLKTALSVVDMCREKKDSVDILGFAQSSFLKIEDKEIEDTILNVKDIVGRNIDRIEEANIKKDGRGYATGFPVIDRRLTIKDGKLIIIAGRPKMGKTSLAVTIARNMDRENIKTGFLSLEMPEAEIMDKLLAIESNIDSSKFSRYKGLSQKDYEELAVATSIVSRSEMILDSSGNLNFTRIAQRCRKMVKDGAKVIFIDQLSQVKGMNEEENRDRFARFSENVNRFASLKKELDTPIVLLAQLSRKLEQRLDKEPMLSDLKMTGNLEEDADAVLFVYRPAVYETTNEFSEEERYLAESKTVLNLAANRSGGTVWTNRIRFNPRTQYFYAEE